MNPNSKNSNLDNKTYLDKEVPILSESPNVSISKNNDIIQDGAKSVSSSGGGIGTKNDIAASGGTGDTN